MYGAEMALGRPHGWTGFCHHVCVVRQAKLILFRPIDLSRLGEKRMELWWYWIGAERREGAVGHVLTQFIEAYSVQACDGGGHWGVAPSASTLGDAGRGGKMLVWGESERSSRARLM